MDNSTPAIIGAGISAVHTAAIFATSDQGLTKCIHNNNHAQIHQSITFLFENYGDIYELCTCIISSEDWSNPGLYYSEKDISDLTYSNLDPIYFLVFLSDVKTRPMGNCAPILTYQCSMMP